MFFLMSDDVERFCTELKNGALEGLCSCVSEGVIQFLEDKVKLCFSGPPLPLETDGSLVDKNLARAL